MYKCIEWEIWKAGRSATLCTTLCYVTCGLFSYLVNCRIIQITVSRSGEKKRISCLAFHIFCVPLRHFFSFTLQSFFVSLELEEDSMSHLTLQTLVRNMLQEEQLTTRQRIPKYRVSTWARTQVHFQQFTCIFVSHTFSSFHHKRCESVHHHARTLESSENVSAVLFVVSWGTHTRRQCGDETTFVNAKWRYLRKNETEEWRERVIEVKWDQLEVSIRSHRDRVNGFLFFSLSCASRVHVNEVTGDIERQLSSEEKTKKQKMVQSDRLVSDVCRTNSDQQCDEKFFSHSSSYVQWMSIFMCTQVHQKFYIKLRCTAKGAVEASRARDRVREVDGWCR